CTDWNQAVIAGWWQGPPGTPHAPEVGDWYVGYVTAHRSTGQSWVTQEVWNFAGARSYRYTRLLRNGVWTAWAQSTPPICCFLYSSSNYSAPNGFSTHPFNTVNWDLSRGTMTGVGNAITIPSTGIYHVGFGIIWSGGESGGSTRQGFVQDQSAT